MAAIISASFDSNLRRWHIDKCTYPKRVDVVREDPGPKGMLLPKSKGFPSMFAPPGVSFKVYRALCTAGMKNIADKVLAQKKRSFVTPNYIWNGLMKYSLPTVPRTTHPAYMKAVNRVRHAMNLETKIPITHINDAVVSVPKTTSPGLPYLNTHPGKKKGEILDEFFDCIKHYWDNVALGIPVQRIPDCAAFARSHIGSPDKNKVRPVWAYPILAIAQEACYAVPLTTLLKNQDILRQTAYGMEMMKGGMNWLHNTALRANAMLPGCKYLMIDYSSFDSTVPAWLIRDAFNIIGEKMDFSKCLKDGIILDVDPEQEKAKFRKVVNYFINTPVRNSDGNRFLTDHGIPSGSMFTNLIGTVVNLLITYTVTEACIQKRDLFTIAFGDDGLICLPNTAVLDIENYARTARSMFGMEVNVEKSFGTNRVENIHFLGYSNHFGSPVKPAVSLIASMMYPQFETDDWAYAVSRALGCLLAAAGSSTDVFLAARAVWILAGRMKTEALTEGLENIRKNPRSLRFLINMGCGDIEPAPDYFYNINLSLPRSDCTKIEKNIDIIQKYFLPEESYPGIPVDFEIV